MCPEQKGSRATGKERTKGGQGGNKMRLIVVQGYSVQLPSPGLSGLGQGSTALCGALLGKCVRYSEYMDLS